MIFKNRIIAVAIALVFLLSATVPCVLAADVNEGNIFLEYESKARAIYLYSFDGNRVLYSKGESEVLQPVSTAKMMVGVLVCERYKQMLGNKVMVTSDMLKGHTGTSMGLCAGMTLTVKDLLFGTVCGGNNDAALALAVACAGTVDLFVDEMNKLAKRLDMRQTNYTDPTGIDPRAKTSLEDVAKLSRKAIDTELYLTISSLPSYEFLTDEGENLTVYNRNAFISQFSAQGYLNKSSKGLSAGSTDEGGYVLSTYAEKNGKRFLCIVMNASADENEIYSYAIAASLIDKGFRGFSMKKIAVAGEVLHSAPIDLAIEDNGRPEVRCTVKEDVYAFVPQNFDASKLTCKVYLHNETVNAPVDKFDVVGGVDFYYEGNYLASTHLVAAESVDAASILVILDAMRNFLLGRVFWITVIISALVLLIYFVMRGRMERKSSKILRFKRFY